MIGRWDRAYRAADAEAPDYAAGLAELQRGILFGVTDCDLYYRMGYCYEKLGRAEEAERAYRMALASRANCPTDILYYVHLHAGMLAFKRGELGEACRNFASAAEIMPERWVAANNLAVVERERGKGEGAAPLPPPLELNPVLVHNRAIILAEEGRGDDAVAEYDNALAAGAGGGFLLYGRAEVLNASGRHGEAARGYLDSALVSGGNPLPYLRAAEIALLEGRYERFIIAFQKALDIDPALALPPGVAVRMRSLAPLLANAGDGVPLMDARVVEAERSALLKALAADASDTRSNYDLARLYEYNSSGERYGDGFIIGRAFEHYARALSRQPDHAGAHLGLGAIYHLVGADEAALKEYAAALREDGALCAAFFNSGLIHFARRSYAEAVGDFRGSLQCVPDNALYRFHMAMALAGQGKYEEAIKMYEQALSILPGDPGCYFNLARIYSVCLGDAKKGAEYYRLYLRSRPDAADRDEVLRTIEKLGSGESSSRRAAPAATH